jgi:rare lipoprotein A
MSERYLPAAVLALMLAACAVPPATDDNPPPPQRGSSVPPELPPDAVPRPEERSRYGNGPIYEVYGKPYQVMNSSHGYTEQGVASWYGKKFHGRLTSNQEPYDMHALTAAHKTLPLPTYVRVRNLRNDRSVVVRVNDRGPFVDNRIIDLSYAAARRLDMIDDGTTLVEVTAIGYDEPPAEDGATVDTAVGKKSASHLKVYVQVGAFGERGNAERQFRLLQRNGIENAFVHREEQLEPKLFRVRIGPIADVRDYDTVAARLQTLGIADSHLVSE